MIVFDEYAYIENILIEKKADKIGVKRLIMLTAKYYYHDEPDITTRRLNQKVMQTMAGLGLSPAVYQEYKYANFIKSTCSKIVNGKMPGELKIIKSIALTKPEMERVQSAPSEKARKLLFTLYVLAKNKVKPTGWVNYRIQDIFSYANLNVSRKERYELLGILYHAGLMELNKVIGKSGYKVELLNGEPEIELTDMKDFGKQYIAAYKEGWGLCRNCGKLIRIKSKTGRPLQYCTTCANKIRKDQQKEAMKKLRELQKNGEKNSCP